MPEPASRYPQGIVVMMTDPEGVSCMPPAVRLSDKAACPADKHGCPACPHPTFGPAVNGSTDVFINKLPSIRLDDPGIHMACCGPNQWQVAKGSPSIYVNGKPMARMGDKTKHCGGDGAIIIGSPNVFADDGGLTGLAAALAMLKNMAITAIEDAFFDGESIENLLSWDEKAGKGGGGKAGKGGGKGSKSGGQKKGGAKGSKKGGESSSGSDASAEVASNEDLSSDVGDEDSTEAGGLLRLTLEEDEKVFAPGELVKFTLHLAKDYEGGDAEVMLVDRTSGEEFKTSVTPGKKDKSTVTGSLKAPPLAKDDDGRELARELSLKAVKGEGAAIEAGDTVQVVGGDTLVLRLFQEARGEGDDQPEGDEPTNERPGSTSPIDETVKASVTIQTLSGERVQLEAVFESGVAYVKPEEGEKPKAKWPEQEPADGEAYDVKVLAVEIKDSKYRDWSVKAFAPKSKSKK